MKTSTILLALALGGSAFPVCAQAQNPSSGPSALTAQTAHSSSGALANGFDAENLIALTPVWHTSNPSETMWTFLERVRQLPGVAGAAVVFPPPFLGVWPAIVHQVEGRPPTAGAKRDVTGMWITDGFFETVRTPLLKGRLIGPADRQGNPRVALVNESFSRCYFGATSPLGKSVECEFPGGDSNVDKRTRYAIIGVVADARYADLLKEPHPMIFFAPSRIHAGFCVVRPAGNPQTLTNELARLVRQTEPACTNVSIFPLRQRENPGRETLAL